MRLIAPDRLGWGDADAPEGYRATTISEQAEHAAALLSRRRAGDRLRGGDRRRDRAPPAARPPELVSGAVLVEPPLLSFSEAATPALSADRAALEAAHRDGGPPAAVELYLSGALEGLGPGAGRLPARADSARPRAPIEPLCRARRGARLEPSAARPRRGRASLADRGRPVDPGAGSRGLGGARRAPQRVGAPRAGRRKGPPHLGAPGGLAELILELSPGDRESEQSAERSP